ncbi:hypothetical protein A1F94_013501 [Pyrenophora tritici-repentis]|uniref:Uncharacterized protein n=1 Tax=Pyrenophora tritici-repentis TaxID=45151 RepID=A0A2W1HLM3_9PLEO|nr:hypothetical protein PtrV1_05526 [Pyrenophora tritici-repentis]KAF7450269.1 hypothetical protein A1F99_048850 [Pyrenophora tritici-repentis]KAF7572842.1 hypothetical protein PtrM4_077470 [Pyrenophora tritici-repentis]KAG9376235.1 hypothetical protein A1F94_013501 [Pyrenophora tritici-repentis]KAI0588165.1 hypothetical protein Alg215_01081 [Pyrenophora tritici-repentis]
MASMVEERDDASRWQTGSFMENALAGVDLKGWATLLALLIPLFLLGAVQAHRKMQHKSRKPFPFLELPQELRDMVYEHFLEDPVYPPPPRSLVQRSSLEWMYPSLLTSASSASRSRRHSKWIFLANKQVYAEYLDMLCKRNTFHLSVSPQTYKPIAPTASSASSPDDNKVWQISPSTLSKVRNCSLSLVTTSSMLGVTDPRSMTSSSWTLGQRMREQLKHMGNVHTFTLNAKALGDPLWNPLWIWYHASQSLKMLGTEASDTVPIGPQLTRITFSLDTWSPGENYVARSESEGGKWMWCCNKDHPVGLDIGPEITVREFCAKLYQECRVCRIENGEEE